MNETPHFSRLDADRILRRAAEIEGSDEGRHLTVAELRLIAEEAGFGADAVQRAIAEARDGQPGVHRPAVQRWGLVVTHLSAIREVPVEVSSEQLMRAVRLVQPYREGPPQVKLEEHEVTWRDRKGLRFAVTSANGVTEIRVYVSRVLVRRGRWMGWVKAAADRLETLVLMVAARGEPAADEGAAPRLARPRGPGAPAR
jgi:hypothetical protein